MSEHTAPATPGKWWHTLLTTPALLVALGGGVGSAVPALWAEYKAWKLGIQTNRLQIVEEQHALWEKNLSCLQVKPVYTIAIDDHTAVGVTLCVSGDALLTYQRSQDTISYTWVKYPEHAPRAGQGQAQTGETVTPQTVVSYGATRCVVLQGALVLWVRNGEAAHDGCWLEYISTHKGLALKRGGVACETCEG